MRTSEEIQAQFDREAEYELWGGNDERCSTYLYVLVEKDTSRPIKIGIAEDIDKRLQALQTGNHRELAVLHQYLFHTRRGARRAEELSHAHFASALLRGEWFDVEAADADRFIRTAFAEWL